MLGIRKTLWSILLVVFFMALAALATFYYNTDTKQQEKMSNNDLVKTAKVTIETLLGASEKVGETNAKKNIGFGKVMTDWINRVEWQRILEGGDGPLLKNEASTIVEQTTITKDTFKNMMNQDLFSYQKTEAGAEVIVRPKNSKEYKLPLPFKFLK